MTRPTRGPRHPRFRWAAPLLAVSLLASGAPMASADVEFPYGPHPDMPFLWTVAHGPFCGGWVKPTTIVNREAFPGQVWVHLWGSFVGLSWNPPRFCWSTVTVRWHNLDTGARGEYRERVDGSLNPFLGESKDRQLDTGRGRIRFDVSTDLPHMPVSHEVVVE